MSHDQDIAILRDLAKRYAELCAAPVQAERRRLWRRHNSLKPTRPLIYVRAFAWNEMPQAKCVCVDPFLRRYEDVLRRQLFCHTFNDDSIFEPWVTMPAVHRCQGWGIEGEKMTTGEEGGAYKEDYPVKALSDVDNMRVPRHEIDEKATLENAARLRDAIGDVIEVNVDRSPAYRFWGGDLSTDLGHLRGIENIMLDMLDNPEWLHGLMRFMSDGVLKAQDEAEAAGDWSLSGDYGSAGRSNQAMPHAEELPDPAANVNGVPRKHLWCYMAAQEFTSVSPEMHEEFLLRYQMPIMAKFGLTAYGCCEDLTRKIDMLRAIPNLRRIAVSPFANVPRCAEQIGKDYVISYRPSPADMVSYGFDPARIRTILRRDLQACRGCHVDITLKDVETVERDPDRIRKWVAIAREVMDEIA